MPDTLDPILVDSLKDKAAMWQLQEAVKAFLRDLENTVSGEATNLALAGRFVSVVTRHIEPLTTLPFHHKDPFDRLIAATALVETMRLVSDDVILDAYGVNRLW